MNYRNRAIKAYKSTNSKAKPHTITEEVNDDILNEGFLKLTKEEVNYNKIAKFLLLLGSEEAAKVVKHLSPKEIETISKEINQTERVDRLEAEKILKEFGFHGEKAASRKRGGADAAKEILNHAFGKEKAEYYLRKSIPDSIEGPFSFLNDLNSDQLLLLLKNESLQVLSLIIRYLDPSLSSMILKTIDKSQSALLIKKIAKGGSVSKEIIEGMEESLKEKIRTQGDVESIEIDGPSTLAGILKFMKRKDEKKILSSLEEESPELSKDVQEKLYSIDTVLHMNGKDLETLLRETSDRDISFILRIVDHEVKNKICNSISQGRLLSIREEDDLIGSVKKAEAYDKMDNFLELLKKKEDEGTFVIIREEEEYF